MDEDEDEDEDEDDDILDERGPLNISRHISV